MTANAAANGCLLTRALKTARFRRSPISASAEAHRMPGSEPHIAKSTHWRNAWLGREDSNLRMAESKSA
jgi:hypothetical protein